MDNTRDELGKKVDTTVGTNQGQIPAKGISLHVQHTLKNLTGDWYWKNNGKCQQE